MKLNLIERILGVKVVEEKEYKQEYEHTSLGNIVIPEKLSDDNAFLLANTVSELYFPVDFYADRLSKLRYFLINEAGDEVEKTPYNRLIKDINPFYSFNELIYQYIFRDNSSLFSAFWLGQFPELSVMRNSCTATLFQKFSYDTRNIIKSQKFREVFKVELASDKQNLDGWNLTTSKQVGYFGAGVGGTIIGFGANIAITDDLYKSMQDAMSTTTNNFAKLWKQSAHDSRKEKNCPEIYIGTRWVKDDIIGEALANNKIDIEIKIPALDENGNSFCEAVKTTKEYHKIKNEIDNMVWLAEYMQDPTNPEGLLIPLSKLQFTNKIDVPDENVIMRFAIGDPANTGGDKYSMPFLTVAVIDDNFAVYVEDVIHSTFGIEANTERVLEKTDQYLTELVMYESNGVGLAAILLIAKRLSKHKKLVPFTASINKEVRILSHFEFVMKYFIFDKEKYENNKEYRLFVSDLTSYTRDGDNKNKKDAIDVCCSAANILKIKFAKYLYSI